MSDDGKPRRPNGVTDDTVEAVGLVSEALEYVERARGALYTFHQLLGGADLKLGEACDSLRETGHADVADRLETDVVGRNVLRGRWTFQIVEEFDDVYWSVFRDHERRVRDELQAGNRHVLESEISDHFHPWNDEQGQAPFVWGVIGALSEEAGWRRDRAAGSASREKAWWVRC